MKYFPFLSNTTINGIAPDLFNPINPLNISLFALPLVIGYEILYFFTNCFNFSFEFIEPSRFPISNPMISNLPLSLFLKYLNVV